MCNPIQGRLCEALSSRGRGQTKEAICGTGCSELNARRAKAGEARNVAMDDAITSYGNGHNRMRDTLIRSEGPKGLDGNFTERSEGRDLKGSELLTVLTSWRS